MDNNLITTLTALNIGNPEFFQFMQGKIQVIDNLDLTWYGVFPLVSVEGILQDIRMLVPSIDLTKKKTVLINIHEFMHAYELYQVLNQPYQASREELRKRIDFLYENLL